MSLNVAPVDQLGLFVHRVDELLQTRLIRNGFSPSVTLELDRMKGLSFSSRQPDEDDLRSFLLTLRHFMSDREPVHLFRIYNLCQQQFTSEELKGCLIRSRQIWSKSLQHGGIKLVWNDRDVAPEKIFDLWINGVYFHNDPEKRRFLERLLPHEKLLLRYFFLDFLIEATRQVVYVGHVVRIALRDGLVI